jgi:membrane-associated HD superfamily phosphohydrolase
LLSIIFLSAIFLPAFSILSAEDLPIQQIPTTEIQVFGEQGILTKALNWFFNIVIILGVIFVIYAGFSYITSSGDPAKTKRALQILMYALIGIAIAVLAKALINFVTGWVGVNQGQGIFPTQ